MPQNPVLHYARDDVARLTDEELRRELAAAHKTIGELRRRGTALQRSYDDLLRAYRMTVANLVQRTAECTALERERDDWRCQAQERSTESAFTAGSMVMSDAEIAAVRKAMARLHHPDTGGDPERMKAWNAVLDVMEG